MGVHRTCAVSLALLALACSPQPDASACFGVCGPNTRCDGKQCVASTTPTMPDEIARDDASPKRGRRGRKRAKKSERANHQPSELAEENPIPEYDANAKRVIDLNEGDERLSDSVVNAHMRQLEPAFNKCIAEATERTEGSGVTGRLDLTFGIANTGRVESLSVRSTPNLRSTGLLPCVRGAVGRHRFPTFDGPTMSVDYSFAVD